MNTQSDLKKFFSSRLKQLMTENNETIYTIASVVKLSPPTISRYTKGLMSPKIPTIQILAQHFNVDPAWLMGASNDRCCYFSSEKEDELHHQIVYVSSILPLPEKEKLLSFAHFLLNSIKKGDVK